MIGISKHVFMGAAGNSGGPSKYGILSVGDTGGTFNHLGEVVNSNGDMVFTGMGGPYDGLSMIKFDKDFNVLWHKTFLDTNNSISQNISPNYGIHIDSSGNYYALHNHNDQYFNQNNFLIYKVRGSDGAKLAVYNHTELPVNIGTNTPPYRGLFSIGLNRQHPSLGPTIVVQGLMTNGFYTFGVIQLNQDLTIHSKKQFGDGSGHWMAYHPVYYNVAKNTSNTSHYMTGSPSINNHANVYYGNKYSVTGTTYSLDWENKHNAWNIAPGYGVVDSTGALLTVGFDRSTFEGLVFKSNSSGTFQWAKRLVKVGTEKYKPLSISVDSNDDVYCTWVDNGTYTKTFIAKFNGSNGNLIWLKSLGIYSGTFLSSIDQDDDLVLSNYGRTYILPNDGSLNGTAGGVTLGNLTRSVSNETMSYTTSSNGSFSNFAGSTPSHSSFSCGDTTISTSNNSVSLF